MLRVIRINLEPSPDWNQNTGSGDQNQGDGLSRVPEEFVRIKKDSDAPGRIQELIPIRLTERQSMDTNGISLSEEQSIKERNHNLPHNAYMDTN